MYEITARRYFFPYQSYTYNKTGEQQLRTNKKNRKLYNLLLTFL